MKQILHYLKEFWKKDFHLPTYAVVLVFIIVAIALNYTFDFEDSILDPHQRNWWAFFLYVIYYAVPYYFVILVYWFLLPNHNHKINHRFLFKSSFAIVLLAFKVWFFYHIFLAPEGSFQTRYLFNIFSNRLVNVSLYAIGLLFFYKMFEIENKNLYGLATKEFNFKPYFLLLLFMVPLLLWASFQPDFLASYPRLNINYVKTDYLKWFAIFEPLYMSEFITLEWFFRGFLVVGMVQLLGHRAVLPMAVLYCVFHFGKPMGECIGSLFGGYILGVIAYYTRSVWGGIIVHMGIAFLMDAFALLSHLVWKA